MARSKEPESTLEISKELLLQDYRYRSESLWKSEQAGETRVQLFIGFVTAVGAGLGLFVKENLASGETLRFVVLGWLFALLVVGLVTLARMVIRNKHTDECKKGLDAIRQVFRDIDKDGVLLHYYPIAPPSAGKHVSDPDGWWTQYKRDVQPRKFGGLAHTVAATNSLIIGAMIVVATAPAVSPPFPTAETLKEACAYGLIAAAIGFLVQLAYLAHRQAQTKEELRRGHPTRAGGIVFRSEKGRIQYLLVSATEDRANFVLPKGHIEDSEGHGEAALREVREETGVVARLIGLVASNIQFEAKGERVDAKFYLMERLFEIRPKDKDRIVKWFLLDEALAQLKFPESKYALAQGEARRAALLLHEGSKQLETKLLPEVMDGHAPDGSEIRLLSRLNGGGVCHCTLPGGSVSHAVYHKTVEEIWFFLSGKGKVWRKLGDREEIVDVSPGVNLTIPLGAHFQFRSTGTEPLCFVIATMPPWPGPDEAVPVTGCW